MDFNNDIGSFGLPLIDDDNSTKSSRRAGGASVKSKSKKKLKKLNPNNFMVHHHIKSTTTTTTAATASTKMSKKKRKRLQKQQTNVREEVDSSSDDESLALSQLAVITNKPAASNDGEPRQHTNSNKVQRKDKKQAGLHSFLVKSNATTSTTATTNNASSKKRSHSFISAKSITINDNCIDVKSNVNYNDDIIDYFSDNNDEELASSIITDNKVQTTLDNNAVSSKDQEDVDITKELQQKQQMKQQKKLENRIQFGINNTIIGHNLPTRYGSSNNNKKTNVLSTLNQRTYLGGNKTYISNSIRQYVHSSKHYNICDTVNLSASTTTNNNIGEVTTMSFDKDGILLATGDDKGNIRIYDFDDVNLLDVTKRNEVNKLYLKSQENDDDQDDTDNEMAGLNDTNEGEEDSRRENDETDNAPRRGSDETGNSSDEQSQQRHTVEISLANPILSFQCKTWLASRQGRNRPRISSVKWCPENQDHLLVSFANQSEVHIYDIASNKSPLPCLRVGGVDLTAPSRPRASSSSSEGILKSIFISSKSNKKTQVITGGNYGTVQLWAIPQKIGSNINAKSQWSISVFGNGEGVCDLLSLPLLSSSSSSLNNTKKQKQQLPKQQPLVLVAGNGASLALLDTNRITRKAFSTSVSPTIAASWDIHQLASREYAKIDSKARLPNRRWMTGHQLSLLGHGSNRDVTWYKVGIVAKCGWVFVAEISLPSSSSSATNALSKISLQLNIVHHTPRIQCFNSLNEPLDNLGGMALQFSLPDESVPSSLAAADCGNGSSNMLWLGDVKTKRYTLPSKDKYILCEDHGKVTSTQTYSSSLDQGGGLAHQGDGIILANLNKDRKTNNNICASIPLSNGSPVSLAVHPSGEWIVVGYGNGRNMGEKNLEILSMRKK